MATYDRLQQTAMRLRKAQEPPLSDYERCEFPQVWARELWSKVFVRDDIDEEKSGRRLPLWAVTQGIAALMPHTLVSDASGQAGKTWLAWDPQDDAPVPDRELLVELVRSGLVVAAHDRNEKARRRGRRGPIDMQELAAVLASFRPSHLYSTARHLRIGPEHALTRETCQVLPNLIAGRLIRADWKVEHTGWNQESADGPLTVKHYGTSSWRRVACAEGAELISWPPRTCKSSNGVEYPWSYTLHLTTQNHTLDPHQDTLLHAHMGIRRWARMNVWDGQRAISAYLFTPSPWGNKASPFGRAQMKWHPGPKGKKEGKMVWDDVLASTLARFTSEEFLPSAVELAANPQDFLQPGDGSEPLAGMPFRDGLGEHCHHIVGTGVSARDRWQIFHQLADALKEIAEPVRPLERVPVSVRPRPSADDLLRIDQQALARATGPRIVIDVLWDTRVMRTELLAALHRAFGHPAPGEPASDSPVQEYVLPSAELTVIVRTRAVGEIAAPLEVDRSIKTRKDRLLKATSPRRMLTLQRLRDPDNAGAPRFALVEMPGAKAFLTSEHDPKETVKSAASSLGVLAQNITPPLPTGTLPGTESKATRTQRANKAVLDVLTRQTGLLSHPEFRGTKTSPLTDVTTVGLWVVRRNKAHSALLPVAIAQLPDEPFARIRHPHTSAWVPYGQGLLALDGLDTERRLTDAQVCDFFGEAVEEIADGADTALLTLAQNIRACCPGLSNGLLEPDAIAFNPKNPLPEGRLKGVRHLRLRTNLRDETSQHYSYADGADPGDVGVGSHFWRDPNRPRHFFSTGKKPATAGGGSPQGSRVEAHWARTGTDKDGDKTYGMKHETRQDVWNPQLLEIVVARHAPDDNLPAWASIPHQQRYEATHFSDPLQLPAVLHLGYSVAKHILPDYLVEPIDSTDG
ncbi:RNaseH domain-containing protein [Streptomyces sp. NPDC050095]|uniref:RNaseH domain-containing protein n=1 Tax=unclassified Streptomyces TaxID=2593676 RepID=UPI0034337E7C